MHRMYKHNIRSRVFSGKNDGQAMKVIVPSHHLTSTAARIAAPEEIPTKRPSWVAAARAVEIAASEDTANTSSTNSRRQLSGTKPAPIP